MLDLPVLRAEAHVASRRRSTYGMRAAGGLLLLVFLWSFHRSHEVWSAGRLLPNNELTRFTAAGFEWLAVGQALVVMAFVPAMVAGSVAEERSCRTLDGLLASRLSSAGLIADKLAAKTLHIGAHLAVGLPIVCLLGLLGGIDPRSIAYAYGGTVSTALFLAALSLVVSVYSRGPTSAILLVYLMEAVWLFGPWIVSIATSTAARPWSGPLASVNGWILPTTPLSLVTPATLWGWAAGGPIPWFLERVGVIAPGALTATRPSPGALAGPLNRMIGHQLAYAAALLIVASWRLRPAAQRLADAPRGRTLPKWLRSQPRTRPSCGDDPMLWKERWFRGAASAGVIFVIGMLASALLALLTYDALFYRFRVAREEFVIYGYADGRHGAGYLARESFLSLLLVYSVLFYVAALIAVAVRSATGVSGERETGTWGGLLVTPLEPAEIVRAKVLGALGSQRILVFLVLAPWLFGLALGALHPIGLLLAATGMAAFLYFAAALGTLLSFRSRSSGQALARTMGLLIMMNLGSVIVGRVLAGSSELGALFGSTALLLYYLPISTHFMQVILAQPGKGAMILGLLSAYISAYAAVGWVLCRAATRGFDRP
jgi:ABC-type transport system involved in multi-copper enzyme maturation permease subunit